MVKIVGNNFLTVCLIKFVVPQEPRVGFRIANKIQGSRFAKKVQSNIGNILQ